MKTLLFLFALLVSSLLPANAQTKEEIQKVNHDSAKVYIVEMLAAITSNDPEKFSKNGTDRFKEVARGGFKDIVNLLQGSLKASHTLGCIGVLQQGESTVLLYKLSPDEGKDSLITLVIRNTKVVYFEAADQIYSE